MKHEARVHFYVHGNSQPAGLFLNRFTDPSFEALHRLGAAGTGGSRGVRYVVGSLSVLREVGGIVRGINKGSEGSPQLAPGT